ncbi:MAG: putative signal transducing protein [Haloechinothrix sp.]
MSLWARMKAWLDRPTSETSADDVVELVRLPDRVEAERVLQDLEAAGVRAVLFPADAGGWAPHLGSAQGHRVMVSADELDVAASVLAER